MASRMFASNHPCLPFFISRIEKEHEKGGITMDLCAGLLYVVMMIAIWIVEWREERNK
jgi:hypothetical protein